jgi:steroid delta-isomerase-like uncharacterized protein
MELRPTAAGDSACRQRPDQTIHRHQTRPNKGLAVSDNIEIIMRFERAFRAGDQATIDELCDAGFVDHNPGPEQEPAVAGFKRKVAGYCALFPDLEQDLQDIIASDDTVATRWIVTGTLQREFMGIPATGQRISVEGMNFYRLKNGRVTDIWAQSDALGMMQQLGAIPTWQEEHAPHVPPPHLRA